MKPLLDTKPLLLAFFYLRDVTRKIRLQSCSYWSADSRLLWVLVAYLGYWSGVELARRKVELPLTAWCDKYWNK